jgi:hypothetical protein
MTSNVLPRLLGNEPGVLGRPISHICYQVADIEKAALWWADNMGAGPFFLLGRMEFDSIEYSGPETPVFDHATSMGQWGPIGVELQQMYEIHPAALRDKLAGRPMNHVAYLSPDAEADSYELEARGMPRYLRAAFPMGEVTFHDVPLLGHAIEIHKQTDWIDEFFAAVAAAARDWDGKDPVRHGAPNA